MKNKNIHIIIAPLLFIILNIIPPFEGLNNFDMSVLSILVWVIYWWATEAVSLYVTSLLPMILFPIFTTISAKTISTGYAHPLIFLVLGGSLFAIALERTRLNERIALQIINTIGFSKRKIILSLSIAIAFVSMWISNASATIAMLPIALTVLAEIQHQTKTQDKAFATCMLLTLAHSSSIGGMSTLIGTPPNAVLASQAKTLGGVDVSFLDWLVVGLPVSIISLMILYFMMTRVLYKIEDTDLSSNSTAALKKQLADLGTLNKEQKILICLFAVMIFMLLFKNTEFVKTILSVNGKFSDSGIILGIGVLLFTINNAKVEKILTWDVVKHKIPLGVLLLIGGGISLAIALKKTNLLLIVGSYFAALGIFPVITIIVLIALITSFLTEVNSNTATSIILIPITWSIASTLNIDPMLMISMVALSASSAFMLPTATVPNAIVCSSGFIEVKDMIKSGIWLNITIAPTIALTVYAIFTYVR